MRIEGDTIYYADSQSAPITFKIIRDTLYTYGNDTTYYKIDKQGEHIFWFHSITDNMIRLHKSCLVYTYDAAEERSSVDLGGRRIIKKKTK